MTNEDKDPDFSNVGGGSSSTAPGQAKTKGADQVELFRGDQSVSKKAFSVD